MLDRHVKKTHQNLTIAHQAWSLCTVVTAQRFLHNETSPPMLGAATGIQPQTSAMAPVAYIDNITRFSVGRPTCTSG